MNDSTNQTTNQTTNETTNEEMSVDHHPDDETLERLAFRELDAARTAEVMAHLERCDDCAAIWRAVETMRDAAVEFDPGAVPATRFGAGSDSASPRTASSPAPSPVSSPAPPPVSSPSARFLSWGLAAAAVLAVAVLVWPWRTQAPVPDDGATVVRAGDHAGPAPVAPAEGDRVAEPAFRWTPADPSAGDTAGYTLELLDEDGEVLWVGERIADTEAAWPESVELRAGVYYWRISAHFEDGEETLSSPLVSFEVVVE